MVRAHNFSAGPAALPTSVLLRAREELLDFEGTGASIMELSHRGAAFTRVIREAEAAFRRLIDISDDYAVLFLQGGATLQFSAVPLNLAGVEQRAEYVVSGEWSRKAAVEGARHCDAQVLATSVADGYTTLPDIDSGACHSEAAFLHYCPNETIGGVAFPYIPDVPIPLVADVSSTILSGPLDIARFDVIYAGAQKNIGPAGLTLVVVKRELLGRARHDIPQLLDWSFQADKQSMAHTPPTLAIYLAGLVFEWIEEQGGVDVMAQINRRKAEALYGLIDASDFYSNPVDIGCRSQMNVPFSLADDALNDDFLAEAEAAGLINLKGHRSVGGMRASLYNAVSEASVRALCEFMNEFERRST